MNNLEYLKKAAKNLFKDWKTHKITVEPDGFKFYEYDSHFFDFNDLAFYYELSEKDEESFSLMKAQHMIAQMAGFKKWDDLVSASEKKLELAKLLISHFKNSEDIQDWNMYCSMFDYEQFNVFQKLEIATKYFENKEALENGNFEFEQLPDPIVLEGDDRQIALDIEFKNLEVKNPNKKVRCLHCGKEYTLSEASAVLFPDDPNPMVMCKYFPKCSGSFIDMLDAKKEDKDE